MSDGWQAYVDSNLLGSGVFSKAAIYGHDASIWATSPDFEVTEEEVLSLVKAFNDPGSLYATGFTLVGHKYFTIRSDDRSVYGKSGTGGCCCVKTGQTVIVGHYDDAPAGAAAKVIEDLADYLINTGY